MMITQLTSVLVGIFLLQSTVVDGEIDEVLEMKIANRKFQASRSVICAMLKKANLEGRGYTEEAITILAKRPASKPGFQTSYRYYKSVHCSRKGMLEVVQELKSSLPGAVEKETTTKVRDEIKFRHLDNMGLCKVGLEIYFNDDVGCSMGRSKRGQHQVTVSVNLGIISGSYTYTSSSEDKDKDKSESSSSSSGGSSGSSGSSGGGFWRK